MCRNATKRSGRTKSAGVLQSLLGVQAREAQIRTAADSAADSALLNSVHPIVLAFGSFRPSFEHRKGAGPPSCSSIELRSDSKSLSTDLNSKSFGYETERILGLKEGACG